MVFKTRLTTSFKEFEPIMKIVTGDQLFISADFENWYLQDC